VAAGQRQEFVAMTVQVIEGVHGKVPRICCCIISMLPFFRAESLCAPEPEYNCSFGGHARLSTTGPIDGTVMAGDEDDGHWASSSV
jgi:hypothetical protein